jgi:single-strand DNA-binding protein
MASLNKVMLIGNLGKDPELKYTPSGQAVATFSLATTRKWRDKEGGDKEDTQWHNIKVWGRTAEVANQYLKKGRQVFIEGRLEHRQYEQDGQRKYFTEVVCENMVMMGGGKRDDSGGGSEPSFDEGQPASKGYSSSPKGGVGGDEEDLPF